MKTLIRTIGILASLFLLVVGVQFTEAAPITNWTTHNEVQHRLDVNITPTQTTGIKIAQGQKNGDDVNWLTTTGGTIRVRRGLGSTFSEDIYYRTATIGSDGVATLNGVIRNVCRSIPDRIQPCGDGQQFYAGDIVELTVDARLINWKLDKNRVNILTESGMITGTSTGNALIRFPPVTTAIRDAFTNVGNGDVIYNSTTGTLQQRLAGSWSDIGDASTPLATTTAAGKGFAADQAAISGATIPGYPTWIGVDSVIRTSSGTVNARNKVVATGNNGYLHPSLWGSGLTGSNSGSLVAKGNNTFGTVASSGSALRSNDKVLATTTSFNSTTFAAIDGTNLTENVPVSTGSLLMMNFVGAFSRNSCTNLMLGFKIGNNVIGSTQSGSLNLSCTSGGGDVTKGNASFTVLHKSLTGGTLTIQPVAKTGPDNGTVIFGRPMFFQIIELFRP